MKSTEKHYQLLKRILEAHLEGRTEQEKLDILSSFEVIVKEMLEELK